MLKFFRLFFSQQIHTHLNDTFAERRGLLQHHAGTMGIPREKNGEKAGAGGNKIFIGIRLQKVNVGSLLCLKNTLFARIRSDTETFTAVRPILYVDVFNMNLGTSLFKRESDKVKHLGKHFLSVNRIISDGDGLKIGVFQKMQSPAYGIRIC